MASVEIAHNDPKDAVLFDVNVDRRGLLPCPRERPFTSLAVEYVRAKGSRPVRSQSAFSRRTLSGLLSIQLPPGKCARETLLRWSASSS